MRSFFLLAVALIVLALISPQAVNGDDHSQTCQSGSPCKHPTDVIREIVTKGRGPPVNENNKYRSHVTLYIENDDGSVTKSGWSTRQSEGAEKDEPFRFQPGRNLIAGWTEGVLMMKEGERAKLHIPAKKGYGAQPMGSKAGAFWIPANSDLLFDIEILGKANNA
jgi:FKBP-type peptidyl-prolyl cis-trans isomerase